jgi:acyl-CoA synthetase (AMP-forming)/AMP-acid ligase II
VRTGQRVATALDSGLPMLAVIMAAARIGAESIDRLAAGDRCDACTASPGREPSSVAPTLRVTDEWLEVSSSHRARVAMHDGGPAVFRLAHTSGTTGRPKVVAFSHDLVFARLEARGRAMHLPPAPRLLSMVRLHANYGLQVTMLAFASGGGVVGEPSVESMAQAIARHRVNALVAPPAMLAQFVAGLAGDAVPFPSLGYVEVNGGRLSGRLARQAIARVSPHLYVCYGSTECGVAAYSPWQETAGRPGAAGRLVPGGVEVAVVDANGAPLPRGSEGRLRFRGATCACGYADGSGPDDPFRDGWFESGDLGRIDPDGMLVIAGRDDERINIGGAKIEPERLEGLVLELRGIADVAAFSFPSSAGIERVGLAIVTDPAFDFETFKLQCRERLGIYFPEYVLRMQAIPRNQNGKVTRAALAQLVPGSSRSPR